MQPVPDLNLNKIITDLINEITTAQSLGKEALPWTQFLSRMKLINLDDEFTLTAKLLVRAYLDKEKFMHDTQMQLVGQARIIAKLMLDQNVLEKTITAKDLEIPYIIDIEPNAQNTQTTIKLTKDKGASEPELLK